MSRYPTSIRFTPQQKKFLRQLAKAQQHKNISLVVKRLVEREMRGAAA